MARHVVCLYDKNGLSGEAWAQAGYEVWNYDRETKEPQQERCGAGWKVWMPWDARDEAQTAKMLEWHSGQTDFMMAFPPCDDLATSGSRHFYQKALRDPDFQTKAMALVFVAVKFGNALECPWYLENPMSMISTLWRKFDYAFDPYEYGGYLPEDDEHPVFPDVIAPRDAYPKRTWLWTSPDFVMPPKKPVTRIPGYSKQYTQLGGNSPRTKLIRSMSPRGVNIAIYHANRKGRTDDRHAAFRGAK